MSEQQKPDTKTNVDQSTSNDTRGNPNDPRWKAADSLEQDNEAALGKSDLSKKKEQAGG